MDRGTTTDQRVGRQVVIVADSDGAENQTGTVERVFKSGRCVVRLQSGGFRILTRGVLQDAVPNR